MLKSRQTAKSFQNLKLPFLFGGSKRAFLLSKISDVGCTKKTPKRPLKNYTEPKHEETSTNSYGPATTRFVTSYVYLPSVLYRHD